MGGIGSGRHWHYGARSTTGDMRSIDVRRWARDGLLTPGRWFGWQWSVDGERVGFINVSVEAARVRLMYRSRDYGDEWREHDYGVSLLSQPCNFGGARQWFACPAKGCGKRVAILYGGHIFACRNCYQLAYPSQREKSFERQRRKSDRIKSKLGLSAWDDVYASAKPKGMHWSTYEKLVETYDDLETLSDAGFVASILHRFSSMSG